MGLIRKSLAVSSLGLVRGSSKKQRVARTSMKELQTQTQLQAQQVELMQVAMGGPRPLHMPEPGQTAVARMDQLQEMRKQGLITRGDVHAAYKILLPACMAERKRR